ncbi:MAG: orotate phosphoribosyltransferase [Candidatus Caenarcaniphilales bacterium]|nr:orotate phosphoribosyltransferase [Candidatus Caenarcaniphilales bacterium]
MLLNKLEFDFSNSSLKKAKARLAELLQENSLFKGNFVLASGQQSNYYLDARLTTLTGEGVTLASFLIWSMIQPVLNQIQGVAGPSIGADPIVSGVSMLSFLAGHPLKAGYIRKESKAHGRNKLVEGPLQRNENVIVLEDVVTTGVSSLKAVNSLRENGCIVNHLICLVLREEVGKALLEKEGNLQVHYLFTADELLS